MPNYDNSMLSTYSQCQWKYALRYELHRKSLDTRVATEIGTSTHAIFDGLLNGSDLGPIIAQELQRLRSFDGALEDQEKAQKLFLSAVNILTESYPILHTPPNPVLILDREKRYPRYVVKFYQPEIPFIIPLNPLHNYMGKMDCVVEDQNGHFYILELKTSGRATDITWRDKWRLDTQPRGYTWALRQHTQRPIAGVIIIPIFVGKHECKMTPEITLTYTPEDLALWHHHTEQLCEEISNSNFLPTGMYAGNCINSTLGRCDYFDFCKSHFKEGILEQSTEESIWSPLPASKV